MTTLALNGGSTPDVSTSFTDKWVETASGVSLPTDARLAANGNRPVYVSTVRVYWAGRGASRKLRVLVGGVSTATVTVASGASASLSSALALNAVFPNGGTKTVRIDANPDGSFYFGRESGTGSVDSYGTSFGQLSGSVEYFEVPTAPTSVTAVQADLENAVNVSWTAPSSNGGSAITAYQIQWSYNSDFSGSSVVGTGSAATTYKLTGLSYGSTVYVKVAAINVVATAAGTTSVYSSSATGYIIPPDLPLNGWASFGSHGGSTFTIEHTVIPALIPETGMLREAVSTTASGSYGIGTKGIEKTYTGLTIGREYILSGKAILLTASMPGNIYRFAVNTIGNGSSVTLTSTTVGATIPSYTFTATATSHTVQIELAETVSVVVGKMEHVAFYDFALTRVAVDLTYRLQDNALNASLLDHFDLATQSVGAYWWVDKANDTRFIQDFDYSVPLGKFSDVVADGNLYYTNIDTSYDTSNIINQVTFRNAGVRRALRGNSDVEGFEIEWVDSDTSSIDNWGAREFEVNTNLRTEVVAQNLFPYPSFENLQSEGDTPNFFYSIEQPAQDSTGAWAAYDGQNAFRAYAKTSSGTNVALSYDYRIDVTASTTYYGFGYAATTATPNTRARYRVVWYNDANATISTVYGSYVSLSSYKTWYKVSFSAAAPSGAAYARIAISYDRSTGATFGATGKQWADAMYFGTSNQSAYFDGNTPDDVSHLYSWDLTNDASSSTKYTNILDTRTSELLTQFSTPEVTVNAITFNTAQNPVISATIDIGSLFNIEFQGSTVLYRVTGINHDITPERWMMTLQTAKVI
jgi:hypothetical protein